MDINMDINITDSKEVKSLWSSIKGLAKESVAMVSKGANVAVNGVDKGLGYVVNPTVQFLNSHDNIALALSPETMFKVAALRAYERKFGGKTSTEANVTVQQ